MTMNKALIALALGFALAACSNQEQAADAAADAAATATGADRIAPRGAMRDSPSARASAAKGAR